MRRNIAFTLNGAATALDVEETDNLLDVLRGDLGLTGPRFGCGAGQCGACSVLIDGVDSPACVVEVGHVAGKSVVTVEALGTPADPHPLQVAMLEKQAGQCGYCLSGILVAAKGLLDHDPSPSRAEIAKALDWHLCRCGVHNRVLDAIELAAERLRLGAAA